MKKINLKFALLIFTLIIFGDAFAQEKVHPKRPTTRNVVWFSPTRANTINGLAISPSSSNIWYDNDSLKISGLNIEFNPFSFMFTPYVIMGSFNMLLAQDDSTRRKIILRLPDKLDFTNNQVNGLNISAIALINTDINGLAIAGLINDGGSLNGIAISGGANSYYSFKGIAIAGLANNFYKARGIQIGLFNRCVDCKGLQIGLLNKMGNRTLPILNLRL
jgi:hypothetical protein